MARASSALLKRRLDIAEIVRKQGEVKVDELSDLLNVSGVTIRQDLTYLEQQGYLKRSFGGAIYITPEGMTSNSAHTSSQSCIQSSGDNRDIDLIKNCLDFINDGDVLFLSHGNLIRKLVPFLHGKKSLILIMNDIDNAKLAKEFTDAEIILVGGILQDNQILQDSKMVNLILNQYPATQFIVELIAISSDNELIIESVDQVKNYQQIMKSSAHTIAILPQRMGHNDNNSIGDVANIDIAILSKPAVTEYHQQLLDANFKQLETNKNGIIYQNVLEA